MSQVTNAKCFYFANVIYSYRLSHIYKLRLERIAFIHVNFSTALLFIVLFFRAMSCSNFQTPSFSYIEKEDNINLTVEDYIKNSDGVLNDYKNWRIVLNESLQKLAKESSFEVIILKKAEFNMAFFPPNQIFINTGTLDRLEEESKFLESDFPELVSCKSINRCRQILIFPLIAHELAHFYQEDYALLKKNREDYKELPHELFLEKIIEFKREREFAADRYAMSILERNGYKPDLMLIPLKYLKRLHQENSKTPIKRSDYYLSSHPSPNERIYHITEDNAYKTLKDIELAFHLLVKGTNIDNIKKAISILEDAEKKFPANLELKRAKATAYHRYWIYTADIKDLQFIPILDQPLFSDSEEFSTFKSQVVIPGDNRIYKKAMAYYVEIFEKLKRTDAGFISNYSLLLAYSDLEENRNRSMNLALDAFQKKKSTKILNNLGIVFFLNGNKKEAIKSFWSGISEIDRENINKTISQKIEISPFQLEKSAEENNAELGELFRKIAITNFTFLNLYTSDENLNLKSDLKKLQKIYFSPGANPSPWVKYLNEYANKIH